MFPRVRADYRTLLWVLVPPVLVALQYWRPAWIPWLVAPTCYFALACGVIAHNHNHCPTFTSKVANEIFGQWISIFYGYPSFGWIPTHNLNHHKFVNREGDATITWRFTDRHNLLVAATYPFVSSYYQAAPTTAFIKRAKERNPGLYRWVLRQYWVWALAHATLAGAALALHGLGAGLYVWGMALALPGVFALWTIMLFNYWQHVHTDPWSAHNHSRNWTGRTLNFLLFNNGLHTAHHENPGLHWSKLPAAHAHIAAEMHPSLKQRSFWWFVIKQYALAPFLPKLGTQQVGRAPYDVPSMAPSTGAAPDDVPLGAAGVNAAMLR